MGILLALLALFFWGIGDFLVQKVAHVVGKWLGIFFISSFASVCFFPFVYKDIFNIFSNKWDFFLLLFTSVIYFLGVLIDFKALKKGKLSVVEPIYVFEIFIASLLSAIFLKEYLNFIEMILITFIICGLSFISIKSFSDFSKIKIEKGVIFAIFATIFMWISSFLFWLSSREIDPFMINWFTNFLMMIISLSYFLYNGKLSKINKAIKEEPKLIFWMSFFTNIAWIAFSLSTTYIPISIATSISASYIAFASLLGIIFNKEKLKKHQIFWLIISTVWITFLSFIFEK